METNKIIQGSALDVLKTLDSESVNCIMTSPPYWALRDYGVEGQLGLEPTFQEYINKLCDIFDEGKRVLIKDGTCWVNLGDSYFGSGKGKMSDKSLCNIPARFSIEMQNRGWILRNVIVWHKPNCMPSSVKDRFTVDFEYLFFFVKNKKYWFETQYEPMLLDSRKREKGRFTGRNAQNEWTATGYKLPDSKRGQQLGRNKRAVWKITTKPFREAHFATYPEALCETPIKAGCPIGGIVLDPFFGAGTTGLVALKQNKKFIGIELNPEYIKIAEARIKPFLEQEKLQCLTLS